MTPQPSAENAAPPLGEVGRITGVFIDPKKAFTDIAARPRNWFVPLILLILAALAFTYTYTTRVGWEGYIRKTMENSSRAQNVPADQLETQIQTGAKIAPIFGYVGSLVFIPIAALAIGGVLLLTGKMMGAGESLTSRRCSPSAPMPCCPG
jgi:Yip1 domain